MTGEFECRGCERLQQTLKTPEQDTTMSQVWTSGSDMKWTAASFLLFPGFFSLALAYPQQSFHFVPHKLDWPSARTHCLEHFVDLASVADVKDLAEMSGLVNTNDEYVFVGLKREWEWTVLDSEDRRQTQIGFEAFGAGEPREEHECGMIQPSGEWRTETCNTKWPFFCLDVNVAQKFVKGNGSKVWGKARNYCRTYHTDLARIRSQEENQLLLDLYDGASDGTWNGTRDGTTDSTRDGTMDGVRDRTMDGTRDGTWNGTWDGTRTGTLNGTSDGNSNRTWYNTWNGTWIGLTKRNWSWSDGMYAGFVPWVPQEPAAGGEKACAALNISGEPMGFVPWNCNDQLPFFCYSFPLKKHKVKISMSAAQSTAADSAADSLTELVQRRLKDLGLDKDIRLTWKKRPQKVSGPL